MESTSRKRKPLTIEQKMDILKRLDAHVGTRVSLANELGMPVSTINTIAKMRDSIEKVAQETGPMAKKIMAIKTSPYEELENMVKEWFVNTRAANLPVDGKLLREKALHIATRLGIDNFTASNGWIDRFKKRHNIVYNTVCGESRSVDGATVEDWKNRLPSLVQEYEPRNIFNADETGLFYNLLPSKTLSFRGESCHGGKHSKQRLTVLLFTNCDGSEKLPPIVVGKALKPRCFKSVKTLPTKYHANKNAWMTRNLFTLQLQALDAKMGAQNRKIILFVDNCAAHTETISLRNVKVCLFPPNCTSELQPLDLGIIHSFKAKYRRRLVQKALTMLECSQDPSTMKISVLTALHYIAWAWLQVDPRTIQNCFKKAGFLIPDDATTEEEVMAEDPDSSPAQWGILGTDVTFEEFVGVDDAVPTSEIQSIDDIIDDHMSQNEDVADDDDDEEEEEARPAPTYREAVDALDTLSRYLNSVSGSEHLFPSLYKVEQHIEELACSKRKQTKISDFFSKK